MVVSDYLCPPPRSELAGLAFDSLQQVFRKGDIKIAVSLQPLPFIDHQTVFLTIDPVLTRANCMSLWLLTDTFEPRAGGGRATKRLRDRVARARARDGHGMFHCLLLIPIACTACVTSVHATLGCNAMPACSFRSTLTRARRRQLLLRTRSPESRCCGGS